MKPKIKRKILALYSDCRNVYGPYRRKDGRKILILYDGNKRTAKQLARVKMEVKFGRKLTDKETVDHKDEDITNDRYSNLQVISRRRNALRSAYKRMPVWVKCVWCGKEFKITPKQTAIRDKKSAGPFCSKPCRGSYGAALQNGEINKFKRSEIKAEYYK